MELEDAIAVAEISKWTLHKEYLNAGVPEKTEGLYPVKKKNNENGITFYFSFHDLFTHAPSPPLTQDFLRFHLWPSCASASPVLKGEAMEETQLVTAQLVSE